MAALTDHDVSTLAEQFEAWGFKPTHAATLLRAFYQGHGRVELEALRVGKALQARVETEMPLRQSRILKRSVSADGTAKLLIGFHGGGAVESVLMPAFDPTRAAGCISSQVGCAMGCDFCASTRNGLERNLTAGEIAEQFLHLRELAAAEGRRLTTVVFMGMGEPMHNLDAVTAGIRRIAGPAMGELGWKQVTVSTVGIVPGMDRLAESGLNVHLALSLHGADDETRTKIVPMNRRYGVEAVMAAARRYYERTGRIVTIEYCLIAGVNDTDGHAEALAGRMEGFRAHVNLIPYNPIGVSVSGLVHLPPSTGRAGRFLQILWERKVVAHLRRVRGDAIDAACGQLHGREGA